MIIAPRIATFIMVLVLILAGLEQYARRGLPRYPATFEAAFLVVIAFAGWAMLSALWSPAPWHSLLKPVFMMLIAVAVWFALRTVSTASRPFAHYIGEGALTGIVVGYLLVCFEILTDQLITRTIMSAIPTTHENIAKHVTVDTHGTVTDVTNANLNRRMAILTWLLWPAIMLALHDPNSIRRSIALVMVIGGAGIILVFGSHQSSQIAILGGAVVYGLASINPPAMRIVLASVWTAAVVLALPIALMMSSANLHNADWLFKSARHRVVIWSTTAEESLKSPVLGVGADATRVAMHDAMKRSKRDETLGRMMVGYANHAHNAYLQVWYELGAVGAALFLMIGLYAMRVIGRLETALQPSALALFVTTSLLIAFSYSIWQTWFIAALGFAIAAFAVAVRKRADQIAYPGTADVPEERPGFLT